MLPFGNDGGPGPGDITGSIPQPATAGRDAPSGDWDVVAARIAKIEAAETLSITWTNAATGHSGTITRTAESRSPTGAACRDFRTTLAKIDGVELYEGRICKGATGGWELIAIGPAVPTPATPPDIKSSPAKPAAAKPSAAKPTPKQRTKERAA